MKKSGSRVSSHEVSFVVQGPVFRSDTSWSTAGVLDSIRRHFPSSPIIFSSELGVDVSGLSADRFELNEDPGFDYEDTERKIKNNLARQIQSARSGLARVETPFAVKTRSDLAFRNSRLLDLLGRVPDRPPSARNLGHSQLIVSNFTTVDPTYVLPFAHHPCDTLQAGRTSDLLQLWSCPLPDADYFTFMASGFEGIRGYTPKNIMQFRSEAWVWMNYVKGILEQPFAHSLDHSPKVINESLELFARNLVVVSPRLLGVKSLKNTYRWTTRAKMMTHYDWVKIARTFGVPAKRELDLDALLIGIIKRLLSWSKSTQVLFR